MAIGGFILGTAALGSKSDKASRDDRPATYHQPGHVQQPSTIPAGLLESIGSFRMHIGA